MEIKGELKPGGLPSLIRNFASENFSGVLTITSSVGEKLITLTESEVTVYCDELNETSKLGNILLARGQVTEEELERALKDQQKLEPRPKLGDLLTSRGIVAAEACGQARRFQVEEDICDILSWKGARYVFAGADSAREIYPEDFSPTQVHHLSIDPDTFFKSVAKLTEDWEKVGDRLPTQYLCFKFSAKTDQNTTTLSKNAARVLKLLKEGHTIEGVVKQSCLGRIEVCVQVISLLEKGLILPASVAELRYWGSEHRAQKRFHDALYVYRRLLDSPDAKDERQYLENLIVEISDQIVRSKQAGEYGEESEVVSHKDARDKFLRAQKRRRIAIAVFAALGLLLSGYLLLRNSMPKPGLPEAYKKAIDDSTAATQRGDFLAVMNIWTSLKEKTDPDSELGRNIQERIARVPLELQIWVASQIPNLELQAQRGGDDRKQAIAALLKLKNDYPDNGSEQVIDSLIQRYPVPNASNVNTAQATAATRNELLERLRKADEMNQQKRFRDASREYYAITREAPVNDEIWKQADAAMKANKETEERLADANKKAEEALAANKGDEAIEMGEKIIADFGDLEGVSKAQALVTRLKYRRSTGQHSLKSAMEEEDLGRIFDAQHHYEQVADQYAEFPIAREAAEKASVLKVKVDELHKQLNDALDAVRSGDFKAARKVYSVLLERNPQLLVDQHVDLPVHVTSEPTASVLTLNGDKLGKTPLNVLIRAGEAFEITVDRPGFRSKRIAGARISADQLEIALRLQVEPVVVDFPSPFFAPPLAVENRVVLVNGSDVIALEPPSRDPVWSVHDLFNTRAPIPEGFTDDKFYWYIRQAPTPYKAGRLLLPLRSRDVIDLDLHNPDSPGKSVAMAGLPAEIAGTVFYQERSMLAGNSLLAAPFADGQVRCYVDFEKLSSDKKPVERWTASLDPQDPARHEAPAAGICAHKNLLWVLSGAGHLSALDPVEGTVKFSAQFSNMSPRSAFSEAPNDPLAALVQRNGGVLVYDLDMRQTRWELPERKAMEESVGVLIDASGVYVATRKDDSGELTKYPRNPDPTGSAPAPLWSTKLEGRVELDMTRGKHLFLVTHFNKVFAYSLDEGRQLWEFKIEPELGDPVALRAVGDYVVVTTTKGRAIILKAD